MWFAYLSPVWEKCRLKQSVREKENPDASWAHNNGVSWWVDEEAQKCVARRDGCCYCLAASRFLEDAQTRFPSLRVSPAPSNKRRRWRWRKTPMLVGINKNSGETATRDGWSDGWLWSRTVILKIFKAANPVELLQTSWGPLDIR